MRLRLSISAITPFPTVTAAGLVDPGMPLRKTLIKSVRGKLVGAVAEGNWDRNSRQQDWSRSRQRRHCATRGIEFVLVVQPMTTFKGMPSRETCVQAPPDRSTRLIPVGGKPSSNRPWRKLAVV
jgi:hypothetical protein